MGFKYQKLNYAYWLSELNAVAEQRLLHTLTHCVKSYLPPAKRETKSQQRRKSMPA
jgi:hypothetical protein